MRHFSMSIASDAIRHPISVHSAGILFRHDHCPFGRISCDIFLCPLRRMLSDIPSPSIPREFYSGMIIVHSVAYYATFFYVHCVGCYPTSHLRSFPEIVSWAIFPFFSIFQPPNLHISKFFRTFAPEFENILLRFKTGLHRISKRPVDQSTI